MEPSSDARAAVRIGRRPLRTPDEGGGSCRVRADLRRVPRCGRRPSLGTVAPSDRTRDLARRLTRRTIDLGLVLLSVIVAFASWASTPQWIARPRLVIAI